MELSEGMIGKTVRWRASLYERMREVARNMDFKSENELFNYLLEKGLDSLNGNSDDDASSSDASDASSSSPLDEMDLSDFKL